MRRPSVHARLILILTLIARIDMWGMILALMGYGFLRVWILNRPYTMSDQMQRFWQLWNSGMRQRGVDYTVAVLPQRGLLIDYSAFGPPDAMPEGL